LNSSLQLLTLSRAPANAVEASGSTLLSFRGPGSICNHLSAPVGLNGVQERFAYGFHPILHFADKPVKNTPIMVIKVIAIFK